MFKINVFNIVWILTKRVNGIYFIKIVLYMNINLFKLI